MRRISAGITIVVTAFAILILSQSASSQGRRIGRIEVENVGDREAAAREILVKFRRPPQAAQLGQLAADADAAGLESVGRSGILRLVSRSRSASALLASLRQRPDVEFAEPNYIVHVVSDPSDPLFPQLWGLKNVGQTINGIPGTAGADMHAAEAWNLSIGSTSNVVAVVDTGIDYNHADLVQNMWSAPAPFTVNISGVNITCAAGTHGFNAITRTCNPMDDHNHGTHVAGTIGAVGNNGAGVVGVNWVASIMGLKFLDASGSGTVADAIDAIDFALQVKQIFSASGAANIRVLSNSWGGGDFSQALLDQINAAAAQDILFVAAAGNNGLPNDLLPMYPASYSAPNIVAVAATNNMDGRAFFSNYGAKTVHLGAPGVDILSTVRGGGYASMSGTSMATPHVSGAAALTLAYCPLDMPSLKMALVESVDPVPSMANTTISGGRLNVRRAMQSCSAPPSTPTAVTALGGDRQVRLNWAEAANAFSYRVKRSTTPGGPYTLVSTLKARQFTDTSLANGTTYYYVVSGLNALAESAPSVEVSATPKPPADMVVSSFTVPSLAAAGSPINVSITAKNQGTGAADPSTTKFFISTNFSLDASDAVLPETFAVPGLVPGGSASTSMNIIIPSWLPGGVYYLFAKVDANDVLIEVSENNNISSRSFSVGPDLIVSKLTVPPIAAPGSTIDAVYTVRNQGTDGAAASLLDFYWSANYSVDASDQLLARVNVGSLLPNLTQSGQVPLVVPSDASLGTYYILARADGGTIVAESSETNNTASTTLRVGGDLVIASMTIPADIGNGVPFVANDTTSNAGSVMVAPSITQFYLSPDAALSAGDPLLGSRSVDSLGAGNASPGTTTLVVPGDITPGSYYLFAKADAAGTIAETSESNNTLVRSIKVGPDLVPSVSSVPSSIKAGSTGVVGESVTNRGAGAAGTSVVKYFLSTNFVLDAGDVPLPYTRQVGVLAPNQASSSQTPIPIPAGTTPGTYYLIVQADGDGTVAESTETNNTYPRTIRVD